jgi:hypothetical protein
MGYGSETNLEGSEPEVHALATSSFTVKLSSILGISALIFLVDWFYLSYVVSKGLELKTPTYALNNVNLSVPLLWLPVLGVVLLSVVTWYEAYYRIFPRRGMEIDPMGRMRLFRAITFSTTLFVLVLFVPAIIRSNWYWSSLSAAAKGSAQILSFGNSLLNTVQSLITMNLLWQYSLSQTLAPAVLVLGAWVLGRTARRVRKQ